jgi:hypothetical protein
LGEFFTRADWRPGKRHKRIKRTNNWGGAKVANVAFLEAAKAYRFKPGRTNHRLCKSLKRDGTKCTRLALKGCSVCGAHGGWAIWQRRGILQKTGKKQAIQAAVAMRESRTASASLELTTMPAYQQANNRDRMRMIEAYGTEAWTALVKRMKPNGQQGTDDCV